MRYIPGNHPTLLKFRKLERLAREMGLTVQFPYAEQCIVVDTDQPRVIFIVREAGCESPDCFPSELESDLVES